MRDVLYLFAAVIGFTVLAIAWTVLRARRRTRRLAALAPALGFAFEPSGDAALQPGLADAPVFALAFLCHGRIANVLSGSVQGRKVTVVDCSYRTGGAAGEQRVYSQTIACFPVAGLPDFTLHPQAGIPPRFAQKTAAVLAGIGTLFSGDRRWGVLRQVLQEMDEPGIAFETHPNMAARYWLRGPDREAIRSLFQPAVLDFFEKEAAAPVSVESAAGWLVVYRRNRLVPPAEMSSFLDQAAAVAGLFRRS